MPPDDVVEAMARAIHDANPGVHESWANIVAAEALGNRLAERTASLRRAEARAALRALHERGGQGRGGSADFTDTERRIELAADRIAGRPAVKVGILPLVAGGESGPGARPMHPDWARRLRDQCAAAGCRSASARTRTPSMRRPRMAPRALRAMQPKEAPAAVAEDAVERAAKLDADASYLSYALANQKETLKRIKRLHKQQKPHRIIWPNGYVEVIE